MRSQISLWMPCGSRFVGGKRSTISRLTPASKNSTALRANERAACWLSLLPGDTISITLTDLTTGTLGVSGLDVTSVANSNTALGAIDAAIDTVSTGRGQLGAAQNRMISTIASIANARENLSAAESRIRDVDVAAETADLTRNSILQQAAVSVLAQANVQPQLALGLLG